MGNRLAFRPKAGHFIDCERLGNGTFRVEIQQGVKVCYGVLTPEDARMTARMMAGMGPVRLVFRPQTGHLIDFERLENGTVRMEIRQELEVCYAVLTPEDARMLGRMLMAGSGPVLPGFTQMRRAG
ncbi:hypothetical protein Syn6312_1139 [Synechococcus sp. PCC 6312]|nr:hypothetical protein Syn6312_1139 [Synechococcus sp. PCC 6312]